MAIFAECNVLCPKCKSVQTVEVYGLINIIRDTHLMLKLRDGCITKYTCKNCKTTHEIGIRLAVLTARRIPIS